MKVRTFFSPAEVDPASLPGSTAVVIDVIRATTAMIEALSSGARAILPTASTEEAIRLANSLGREDTLLSGERRGLKIDGFDLGNSPGEFIPERVRGKRLVTTTTNGTRALLAAEDAERIVVAAFLNLDAVADAVRTAPALTFVCAGKEDRFSLDDALCAGMILRAVLAGREETELQLDDASSATLALALNYAPTPDFLSRTAAGAALVEVGLGADLEHCARLSQCALVPEMRDRVVLLPERS